MVMDFTRRKATTEIRNLIETFCETQGTTRLSSTTIKHENKLLSTEKQRARILHNLISLAVIIKGSANVIS